MTNQHRQDGGNEYNEGEQHDRIEVIYIAPAEYEVNQSCELELRLANMIKVAGLARTSRRVYKTAFVINITNDT